MAKRFVRSTQNAWNNVADKSAYNDSVVFIEDAKEIWSNGVTYTHKPDFFYVEGTGTTAGTWKGTHPHITEYYAGLTVAYKLNVAGATTTTLNINNLGAVTVVKNAATAVGTSFPVGSILILTYTVDDNKYAYWKVTDQNSTYSNTGLGHGYTVCSTAAGTIAKTAFLIGYSAISYGLVSVRFTNGITVANPTLNINSKGAKDIYYMGAALTDTELIEAGDIVTFVYDTQYHIVSILKNKKYVPVDEYEADALTISKSLNDLNDRLSNLQLGSGGGGNIVNGAMTFPNEIILNGGAHFVDTNDPVFSGVIYFGDKSNVWIGEVDSNHEAFAGHNPYGLGTDDQLTIFADCGLNIIGGARLIGDAQFYDQNSVSSPTTISQTEGAFRIMTNGSIATDSATVVMQADDSMLFSSPEISVVSNNFYPENNKMSMLGQYESRWKNLFVGGVDIDMSENSGAGVSGNIGVSISNISDGAGIQFSNISGGMTKLLQFGASSLSAMYYDGNVDNYQFTFSGGVGLEIYPDHIQAPAFYETSDIRKKDIKSDLSLDKCYDLIDKCQTVIYSLKDQTREQVGMIAQEIEEFFPEIVDTDKDGFKSLAYDRLVVICFKVLKDIIKRLEKLENDGNRT